MCKHSLFYINPNLLKERSIGCLLGVAIGDALGLPLECKSPAIIRQSCGYVDDYISNKLHNYKEVARRGAGTVSDDTQLTLALMDSFTRTAGYDLKDIRKAHIEAYDGKWGKKLGWGGSTRAAVEAMKKGDKNTAVEKGAGNGTCMKISPLAIYCVYKTLGTPHRRFTNSFNASLLKKCREISSLTHGDPRCIVAAYCQSRMIIRSLQSELPEHSKWIAKLFLEDAKYAEGKLNVEWPGELLSKRMAPFLTEDAFEKETSVISVEICQEQSSFVNNSYPLVAYCASKYLPYKNFRHAVCQTINAGADADSNGAMVGAIVGADLGSAGISFDLIEGLKNHNMILHAIKKFLNVL